MNHFLCRTVFYGVFVFVASSSLCFSRSADKYIPFPKNYCLTNGNWRYSVTYSAPGSKSEGVHGALLYKNSIIPSRFDEIWLPLGKFAFWQGRYTWGNHGWIRKNNNTVRNAAAGHSRTAGSELRRGWYQGRMKQQNTPQHWVRVKRGDRYWWVDPGLLKDLAANQKLSLLHANLMYKLQ